MLKRIHYTHRNEIWDAARINTILPLEDTRCGDTDLFFSFVVN